MRCPVSDVQRRVGGGDATRGTTRRGRLVGTERGGAESGATAR
jgi:hypothetical protein